ncbi:calcium/sodium antiporter [Vulgatibacter sp.]|uniref:calcium/sodium antiporter n=1 Tax=Vulgatibacter sp. TaxID=1971226 RepID=UPI00356216C6
MSTLTLVLFLVGFVALIGGAELLVQGASRIAAAAGISPLVIGLTVVAFGTSAPELAVTTSSAWSGQAALALGNVVGSNVFNVLFILGLSALVTPLVVSAQLVRLDVPLMIGASILAWLFALDGTIGRWDGLVLFAGIVIYVVYLVRKSRAEERAAAAGRPAEEAPPRRGTRGLLVDLAFMAAGLGLLVLGSGWLVDGAVAIARSLGLSEVVIGLTLIAGGTSLPEVATSVLASIRGQRDIAVGNVVGSNLFNLLSVLGLGAVVSPAGLPVPESMIGFDLPVMLAVAVACLPIFFTDHLIARWEGALFLGYYAAYTLFLVLAATEHDALPLFNSVMLLFVLPLTAVTLVLLGIRAWRVQRGKPRPG